MKYRTLLKRLQKLTPSQLNQDVVIMDANNSYFPEQDSIRFAKLTRDEQDEADRDGIPVDDGQMFIKFYSGNFL